MGTKDNILKTAYEIVAEVGFEGATVDQICKEANVTKPTLYHHFGSKDGLMLAVIEETYRAFVDPDEYIFSTTTVDEFRDEFLFYGNKIIDGFRSDAEQQKMMNWARIYQSSYPSVREREEERIGQWEASLKSILQHGIEIGAFPADFPTDRVSLFLRVVFDGISNAILYGQPINAREAWRTTVQLLFKGSNLS